MSSRRFVFRLRCFGRVALKFIDKCFVKALNESVSAADSVKVIFMRILVTGGAGRLGQFTIKELLDHGHEVLSIDRLPSTETVCPSLVIDLLHAVAPGRCLRACGWSDPSGPKEISLYEQWV